MMGAQDTTFHDKQKKRKYMSEDYKEINNSTTSDSFNNLSRMTLL